MSALKIQSILTGLLAFLASVTVMVFAFASDVSRIEPSVAKKISGLSYSDEFGKKMPIRPEKHRLTVLHFWATWCEPCIEEMPALEAFQKRHAAAGVKVYALSMDNSLPKVSRFMEANTISSLRPALDTGMKSFKAVMAVGLPTSVFINSKGQQIARVEGSLDWDSAEVEEFVEEATK